MWWPAFVPVPVAAAGYGLLNLLAPRTTIRWQQTATDRSGGGYGGRRIQERLGIAAAGRRPRSNPAHPTAGVSGGGVRTGRSSRHRCSLVGGLRPVRDAPMACSLRDRTHARGTVGPRKADSPQAQPPTPTKVDPHRGDGDPSCHHWLADLDRRGPYHCVWLPNCIRGQIHTEAGGRRRGNQVAAGVAGLERSAGQRRGRRAHGREWVIAAYWGDAGRTVSAARGPVRRHRPGGGRVASSPRFGGRCSGSS